MLIFSVLLCYQTTEISLSKPKQQHADHILEEKLDILYKLDCGVEGVDICKQFNLSHSILSSWKKQRNKLKEMVDAGKVPTASGEDFTSLVL